MELKGKVAGEISSADELTLTELMFNGVFTNLDKHELVALCACLIPLGERTQVWHLFLNHGILFIPDLFSSFLESSQFQTLRIG